MEEQTLIIIAIICVIAGLPGLYISSQFVRIDDPRILSSVTGKITSIDDKESIIIINVEMDNVLPVVSFENVKVKKGDRVKISGELETYKGKLEFVADKIEKK
ncbi:hypothetical protein GF358_04745 [Candidatus Woesearchaeota archaeon]|nr:hypothetical protein [Candidatus Woesearchaeota archaeon]